MKLVYLLVLFIEYPPAYHAYDDCTLENGCNVACGAGSESSYSWKCENSVCCCCAAGNYDCGPLRDWQTCTRNPKYPEQPAPVPPPLPDCVSSDCNYFCSGYGTWATCNPQTDTTCATSTAGERPYYNFCHCYDDSPSNHCWRNKDDMPDNYRRTG